jgi:hypothetical protein
LKDTPIEGCPLKNPRSGCRGCPGTAGRCGCRGCRGGRTRRSGCGRAGHDRGSGNQRIFGTNRSRKVENANREAVHVDAGDLNIVRTKIEESLAIFASNPVARQEDGFRGVVLKNRERILRRTSAAAAVRRPCDRNPNASRWRKSSRGNGNFNIENDSKLAHEGWVLPKKGEGLVKVELRRRYRHRTPAITIGPWSSL